MSNFFILISSDSDDKSGYESFNNRIKENKWPIYSKTLNTKNLNSNSQILFYIAGNSQHSKQFVGSAIIKENKKISIIEIDPDNKKKQVVSYLSFANINIFKKSISILDHIDDLSFIKQEYRKYYGLYFQTGVCEIDKNSYELITNRINKL